MKQGGEPFSIKNSRGLTIRGRAFLSGEHKKPTVILSHGFNGCCKDLYNRGEAFFDAGINCYMFDFCGGGERSESDGVLAETMTIQSECEDLREVVAYARSQRGTDTENLFLMGESQGGLVSALVAQSEPSVYRGLILWYPAFMIPEHS